MMMDDTVDCLMNGKCLYDLIYFNYFFYFKSPAATDTKDDFRFRKASYVLRVPDGHVQKR